MTKTILSLSLTALTFFTFTGCGSDEPTPAKTAISEFGCKQENVDAPKWTCVPLVDGFYAGVGIAEKSAAGKAHMRKISLANGRSDLAQQIASQVKDKVETYTGTTGSGTKETVDQVTTAVSKQVANINLQNSRVVDSWDAPSGALYLLVTVSESSINKKVKEAMNSSFKSDDALWQQYKSEQAQKSLNAEFPSK